MGKLYKAADKKIFVKPKAESSSHTSHLIPLMTARVAVLSETEKDDILNESLIKSLTGNDIISCRELYGKQFEFKPLAKYIILTNNKPVFDINSTAMLDRIRYIPFNARFTREPKNGELLEDEMFIKNLIDNHINEVFIWLCLGANKYYQRNGKIDVPVSLEEAKNEYINEIDTVSQFINDQCNINIDIETKTKRNDIYDIYKNYCQDNGYKYIRNCDFYKRMEILNHKTVKIRGTRYIKGIEICSDIDKDDQ